SAVKSFDFSIQCRIGRMKQDADHGTGMGHRDTQSADLFAHCVEIFKQGIRQETLVDQSTEICNLAEQAWVLAADRLPEHVAQEPEPLVFARRNGSWGALE